MFARTIAAVSTFALAFLAHAQLSTSWFTIDGGGGTSSGGAFSLSGTIGQHDAGILAGGTFTLTAGFWVGTSTPSCPADFNQDGNLDPDDLSDFIAAFFSTPQSPAADFNVDGNIDPDDLSDFIAAFFAAGAEC